MRIKSSSSTMERLSSREHILNYWRIRECIMSFIEQDFRNRTSSHGENETGDANLYAFFDKPTPENLAANRNEILSPQQQRAIKRHLQSQKGAIALMMGMIACTALFAFSLYGRRIARMEFLH